MRKHWAWPALATLFALAAPLATGWGELGVHARWPVAAYVVFAAVVTTFLWAGGGVLTQLRPPAVLPVSRVLVVLGLVAAAPAVLGLWRVHTRLRRISERLSAPTEPPTRAVDVLDDLLKFLFRTENKKIMGAARSAPA